MPKRVRVLNVAWSLPGGGISHVIASMDKVNRYADVELQHIVIRMNSWPVHKGIWDAINPDEIVIENRLDLRWLPRLIRISRQKRIGLLWVHDFQGFVVGSLCRLLGLKIPILAMYHVPYISDSVLGKKLSAGINQFSRLFLKYISSRVVTVADRYREELIRNGVGHGKIVTVHNGIKDNSDYNPEGKRILQKTSIPTEGITVGTTARLHPQKGLEFLIRAMPSILAKHPNVNLVLLGSGGLESQLKVLTKELGLLDHIHFPGFQENIDDWLSAFDIFILPSLAEGHSISLLEAMRASLPIICTSVGDNLKTVSTGEEALVVSPGDVTALEKALLTLIENAELRTTLASAARQRFDKEFTEDRMVSSTYRVIKTTLEMVS